MTKSIEQVESKITLKKLYVNREHSFLFDVDKLFSLAFAVMGSKANETNSSSEPLPSTASFMTSTLLARRFNINTNTNNSSLSNKKLSNRYNMGTVGRSCVNTIRRSRQNVAIATQVLSPSAIGGSLKGHSVARHFGPPDDDEEGFITYRRHAAWRKLCYYGSAIVAVILILMAIILAVGYMQSEKHKQILSRSVKLVQDRKPSSYIYTQSTTEEPPSLESTDSHEFFPTAQSSFLLSTNSEDSYSSAENVNNQNGLFFASEESPSSLSSLSHKNVIDEDEDDYYNHDDNDSNHVSIHLGANNLNNSKDAENKNKDNFLLFVNDHITIEDQGNEPESSGGDSDSLNKEDDSNSDKGESQSQEVIPALDTQSESVDKLDNELEDTIIIENESVDDSKYNGQSRGETARDVDEGDEAEEHHPLPSEVKVLPPKGFVFSIEIPIYTPNKTSIAAAVENNASEPISNIPIIAPLSEVSEEELFVDKSETNVQSKSKSQNNESKQLQIIEIGTHDDDDDDNDQNLERKQLEENSKEDDSVEDKDLNVYKKIHDNTEYLEENSNKFHAVLHTALFHDETVEEPKSKFLSEDDKNVAHSPAVKIEDSAEAAAYSDENVDVNYSESSDSNEQVVDRSRGRNRHIKILKNDKVMNLKATYTPPSSLKQEKHGSQTKSKLDETFPERKSDVAAQILRLNKIRQGITQLLNKSLATTTPKSKITDSDDFGSLNHFVLDKSVTQRRPVASSTQHVSVSPLNSKTSETGGESKEKGRSLLSSSTLPDFGIDFKSLFESHNLSPQQEIKGFDQQHARSDFGENFAFNLNQFLPPAAAVPSGPSSQDSSQSQLSKRTYNEYDFNIGSPSTSQSSTSLGLNYFAHLLGQNPAVGQIGSPSAAGASLSSYYSPIFPSSPSGSYDISSSATSDTPSLAPGSIPLDLASSFIQVGNPGQYSPSGNGQGQQKQQGYNPYQPQGASASPYSSGSNNGIGSLTTLSGSAPQYNTIAQGMHLLNLISGTVPNNYYQDQSFNPNPIGSPQGSPSFLQDSYKSPSSPSEFQFGNSPSLAPSYGSLQNFGDADFLSRFGGGSQTQSQPQYSSATAPLRSYYNSQADHHQLAPSGGRPLFQSKEETSSSTYSDEEQDQLPAASSFTQNILTTFQSPVVKKLVSSGIESSTLRNAISLITKPKRKSHSSEVRNSRKTQSEPKSFSFEILPGRSKSSRKDLDSGNAIDDTVNSLNVDVIHSSLDNFVGRSKSRKKGSVSLENSRKILSKPVSISGDPTTGTTLRLKGGGGGSNANKSKMRDQNSKTTSKPRDRGETKVKKPAPTGLKSGFFTV